MTQEARQHALRSLDRKSSPSVHAAQPETGGIGGRGQHDTTYLRCEALEERARALVLNEVLNDGDARDLVLEVGVLDARLDRVERRGDGDGRDGARDGGDEVLAPGRLVVVLDAEHVLLGRCGRAEELLGCASDEGASIGLGGYGKEGGKGARGGEGDIPQSYQVRFVPLSIPIHGRALCPPRGISGRRRDHGTPQG